MALVDPPPPLKSSHVLRHESQFDFVLIRRNNIIVNEALRVTCSHLGLDYVEWTRGGNDCGEGTFPDWSGALVSESVGERNLIPGDSKFTRNLLQPIVEETTRSQDSDQLPVSSPSNRKTDLARSCLQQVNNEAAVRRARYFYIITNQELLLCRRTQDPLLSSPIAARRTKRVGVSHPDSTPTRPHAIPPSSPPPLPPSLPPSSPSSLPPSSPPSLPPMTRLRQRPATSLYQVGGDPPSSLPTSQVAPSLPDLFSDSTYPGDDAEDDTGVPECISIPWDNNDGLTVNLGLFVIHLLALISNEIRTEYETLHLDPEYCAKLKI
ncbi:hypothetical protein F5X97DRAFT_338437 [Nemania serpens]|nr:hypothetical protein F5X97DRAFT_338437 [Nemania serpens]